MLGENAYLSRGGSTRLWRSGTRAGRKLGPLTYHLISRLEMDIELIVLNYLGCNSGRYLSSLDSSALVVFTRGLPALIVCLAGAVEAGKSSRSPNNGGGPRKKGTGGREGCRGLPRANTMVVLL